MFRKYLALTLLLVTSGALSAKEIDYDEFAEVFGVVRYHTPNPYTSSWSDEQWSYVTAYLAFHADSTQRDYAELFAPLTPLVSVTSEPTIGYIADRSAENETAYCWRHYGGGTVKIPDSAEGLSINHKQLVEAGEKTPTPDSIYNYKLRSGQTLNIAHALPKSRFSKEATDKLLKIATECYWSELCEPYKGNNAYRNPMTNRYAKLGSAIEIWNAVRHFHPHIAKMVKMWDDQLSGFIAVALDDSLSRGDYYLEQLRLLAPLNDGHIALWPNIQLSQGGVCGYVSEFYAPIELDYIEGRLVVKTIKPSYKTRLNRHDVITKINGIAADDLINEKMQFAAGATQAAKQFKALDFLLRATTSDKLFAIEARKPSGEILFDTLPASSADRFLDESIYFSKERIKNVGDNILYYNAIVRGKPSKKEIEQLASARAVICDLRNGVDFDFTEILARLGSDLKIPRFPVVVTHRPYMADAYEQGEAQQLESKSPQFKSKAYFLVDHRVQSWGETVAQIIRGNNLGMIVGSTTAGTNGDITRFTPSIFQLTITGRNAYNTDGSEIFGIGVKPDYQVDQSYQSTINGKDDLIDYTVKLINQ